MVIKLMRVGLQRILNFERKEGFGPHHAFLVCIISAGTIFVPIPFRQAKLQQLFHAAYVRKSPLRCNGISGPLAFGVSSEKPVHHREGDNKRVPPHNEPSEQLVLQYNL